MTSQPFPRQLFESAAGDLEPLAFSDLTVLLVDDEENVLKSLNRILRREGYDLVSASSGAEGLKILASRTVHMIVSDQRMPVMTGIEFLAKAREQYPAAVRIMLTGYSDLQTAEEAINKVEIYRFLTKPWNDEDLKVTIREGLRNWLLTDFNRRLRLRIEEQNRELWELNQNLERQVEDRTRDLKAAQARLLHSEKMASLGLLAGGVAHEINNPLAGILALAQVLLMDQKDQGTIDDLHQIEQAVLQCRDIIQGLLSFSRQDEPRRREEVHLPSVVERTQALIAHELRKRNLELEIEYDPDLPLIWANPSQLQQVLMNLILNAAQAMGKNGRIGLRAKRGEDGGVELELEDEGPGIPEEVLPKIFDPFFTTKPEGQGTGLGLSITHGIVEDHGGRIEAENLPAAGALFRVRLPPAPPREKGASKWAD